MNFVHKLIIILELYFLCTCCESCQQTPQNFQESLEIKGCSNFTLKFTTKKIKKLKTLVLAHNEFNYNGSLHQLSTLTQLRYLELRDNKLSSLVDTAIANLSNLIELKIKEDKLDFWLDNVSQNVKLKKLAVASSSLNSGETNLNSLPKAVMTASFVNTKVNISWSSNNIGSDKKCCKLQLTNLTLRNCLLEEVALHQCEDTLTYLDLSQNRMKSFEGLMNLNQLIFFNFSHNLIDAIGENDFINMTNIEHLILSNNMIESIPANCFQHNMKLKEVVLSYNRLTHLNLMHHIKIVNIIMDGERVIKYIMANQSTLTSLELNHMDQSQRPTTAYILYGTSLSIVLIILIVCTIILIYQQRRISTFVNAKVVRKAGSNESFDGPDVYDELELYDVAHTYGLVNEDMQQAQRPQEKAESGVSTEKYYYAVVHK